LRIRLPSGHVRARSPSRPRSAPSRRGWHLTAPRRSFAGRARSRSHSTRRSCTRARRKEVAPRAGNVSGDDLPLFGVLRVRSRRSCTIIPRAPACVAFTGRRQRRSRSQGMRSAFFLAERVDGVVSNAWPSTTFDEVSAIRAPNGPSISRLASATQPNAETGSAASARSPPPRSSRDRDSHGFSCFTITTAGSRTRAVRAARLRGRRKLLSGKVLAAELPPAESDGGARQPSVVGARLGGSRRRPGSCHLPQRDGRCSGTYRCPRTIRNRRFVDGAVSNATRASLRRVASVCCLSSSSASRSRTDPGWRTTVTCAEVLGGGAEHRWPADIDHLYDFRLVLAAFGRDRCEGRG